MIELRNASMTLFGRQLFNGLSLKAETGEAIGIIGEKSCGKTSLLKALLGLEPIESGFASIDGEPITQQTSWMFRKMMSYVPQDLRFSPGSVSDLAKATYSFQPSDHQRFPKQQLMEMWDFLKIDETTYGKNVHEISKETLQRILLASAGMQHKPIAIIDDPVSEQSEDGIKLIASFLSSDIFKDTAIVVATDDESIINICKQTITLKN